MRVALGFVIAILGGGSLMPYVIAVGKHAGVPTFYVYAVGFLASAGLGRWIAREVWQ